MKHVQHWILGLIVPVFALCAEDTAEQSPALASFSELTAENQESSSPSTLDEELSLMDEEFDAFKEELFSLEENVQKKEQIENEVIDKHVPELVAKEEVPAQPLVDNLIAQPEIEAPAILNRQGNDLIKHDPIVVDLKQAFSGSPIIYTVLLGMSIFAFCIWLYCVFSLRATTHISRPFLVNIQNKLNSNSFDEALFLCEEKPTLFGKMVCSGIHSRRHGLPIMMEAMKAEGKRETISFWQKIGLLNDIAIIAPMLGLLGTVLGMFYAFYDVNRSIESISTLFDGLGVSVGTTVAGIVVAILALILHSTAKYRLVKALTVVETQAQSVATLIDDRTSIYKG